MPEITCKSIVISGENNAAADNAGRILVYKVSLSLNMALLKDADDVLSADENERAKSYHYEYDRHRFIIGRVALRILLAGYCMMEAKDIVFEHGADRKPFIANSTGEELFFNVSHSQDIIAIAIAPSPVGIDIEHVTADYDFNDILFACFSDTEVEYIVQMQRAHSVIYTLWTRKEAILKATGKGLDDDIADIPVTDGVHKVAAGVIRSAENWLVQSIDIGEYVCSVACDPHMTVIVLDEFVANQV